MDPLLILEAGSRASSLPEHHDLGVIPGSAGMQDEMKVGHFLAGSRYALEILEGAGDYF
jgi:hypothetical protein